MATFSVETVDDSGDVRGQLSVAIDVNGAPQVAYSTKNGIARLAQRSSEGWVRNDLATGVPVSADDGRVSLQIDSQNRPHIGFREGNESHIVYGVRDGSWSFEHVPTDGGVFPGACMHVSMQLQKGRFDASLRDVPNFAFQEIGTQDLCHIAKFGGKWQGNFSRIDDPEFRESGVNASLAFRADEVAQIAYLEHQVSEDSGEFSALLKLATRPQATPPDDSLAGGGWQRRVLSVEPDKGRFCSMANGTAGRNLIAYFDRGSETLKAWVELPLELGPEPRLETIATGITKAFPSAADKRAGVEFSTGDNFRVAYADSGSTQDTRPRYAIRRLNGTWTVETIDESPVDFDAWPHLACDKNGDAHIAFVSGGTLKYALAKE